MLRLGLLKCKQLQEVQMLLKLNATSQSGAFGMAHDQIVENINEDIVNENLEYENQTIQTLQFELMYWPLNSWKKKKNIQFNLFDIK